jgi:hypothetical protein
MPEKTQVYVLRVHFLDENVMSLYSQYQRDFGVGESFMLLDTTDIAHVPSIHNLIVTSKDRAEAIDPLINQFNLPGRYYRGESAYIQAAEGVTHLFGKFDYLWLIEYDVYCKGSFARALKPADNVDCDFLAKGRDDGFEVRKYCKEPRWCWWNDLFGQLSKMPHMLRKGCFFAVTRVTPRFIETVKANLGKSTGFCEIYFPCLCVANGLSYKALPYECIGDVRFQPDYKLEQLEKEAISDKLYHPLKQNPGYTP